MFWPWKVGILIFHYFTICQLTPCVGQVGTRSEVREKASPSYSLRIASNLCRSDCSPRVLQAICAAIFNLTSAEKMWKTIKWKVCQLSPLSPTDYDITISAPLYYTHYPSLGQTSTLDVVMYTGCNISTPQTISPLSSDHNPVVYKVRLTPHHTARKQSYDYHRANWTQYQHILAAILQNPPRIKGERDFDRALHTVTATILMAAEQTIPKRTIHRRNPSIPR
jgi:hypothetical protein